MAHPYICTACRSLLRSRRALNIGKDVRWFSQVASHNQNRQSRDALEEFFGGQERTTNSTFTPPTWSALGETVHKTEFQKVDSKDKHSKKALRPQELLEKLGSRKKGSTDRDHNVKKRHKHKGPDSSPHSQRLRDLKQTPQDSNAFKRADGSNQTPSKARRSRNRLARLSGSKVPQELLNLSGITRLAIRPSVDSEWLLDSPDMQSSNKLQMPQAGQFATLNIRRLGRALERHDLEMIQQIQDQIRDFAKINPTAHRALPLELYEHLMLALLSLRKPQAAIGIWNYLVQSGYKPTVKSYSVMMRGALASRDVSGLKAFWLRMRSAGFQPDAYCWSTRIFGLIKLNLVQEGLQALSEMGQEWLAAAQAHGARGTSQKQPKHETQSASEMAELLAQYPGVVDGVPRPALAVMNSAISALALIADDKIVKVLSWGRSFNVEPDITTYNTLLNVSIRHGQLDDALQLLRQMQERNFKVDSTTWTVILSALFNGGFLDGLDHVEQQEKILAFMDSIEDKKSGMSHINEKGYALIIDRLLKHYENPSAAAAVLARMAKKGNAPTAHIYTILMTSYFQRDPEPDLAAVQTLWEQLQVANDGLGVPLDGVFYDRMIEGYARYHQKVGIRPMLGFLERMKQEGKRPGWKALESVARALAERREWERLTALVEDVRSQLTTARGGTQHGGQRDFWSFVISTGLLKREGIFRPWQLRPWDARRSPLLRAEGIDNESTSAGISVDKVDKVE